MSDADGPRLASADEFPDLLELCDRCFRQERGGMAARLPFAYDPDHPEHHAIVRQDGQVVAHAAAVPQTLVVGGGEIPCPGIGGVATDPQYRGNGYMTALLEFWLDELDAPLVELGGDRQRYGRFGWENGGREFRYRLTPRSFPDSTSDVPVRTYDGEDAQLDTLRELHAAEPYRVKRNRERSAKVYERRGTETLLATGDDPGYLCFDRTRNESTIREFGGTARTVEGLLSAVFDRFEPDTITVRTPPRHQLNPSLRRWSSYWQVTPLRKLNVRDLPGTLFGFTAQMERRLADASVEDETITLGISDDNDRARLRYDGETVTVERTDAEPTVSMDRRELVHLLFGFPDQMHEIRQRHPILDAVCPLTYYIWCNELV